MLVTNVAWDYVEAQRARAKAYRDRKAAQALEAARVRAGVDSLTNAALAEVEAAVRKTTDGELA